MKNNTLWKDTQGEFIQCHGGMILEHDGTFYWYGENKGQDNTIINGENTTRVDIIGISCYSTKDFSSWKNEGLVLEASSDPQSVLFPTQVCERPRVLYNEKTKKFVMWVHLDKPDYTWAACGVAVCDTPNGKFEMISAEVPNRRDSRDFTLYQDDNGDAYLIHSTNWNKTLYVAKLTDDYTGIDYVGKDILIEQEREAPAMFKHEDKYYILTSGCTGWNANSALYAESEHILGQWTLIDNPCEGKNYRKTFNGQGSATVKINDKWHWLIDHWNPYDLKNSTYSILPIDFGENGMTITWIDETF